MSNDIDKTYFRKKYNPKGVTLDGICREMNPHYFDQLKRIKEAESAPVGKLLGKIDAQAPYETDEFGIRAEDEEFAKFIADNPICIVAASEVAPTLARWYWCAKHSASKSLRKHGQKMLDLIGSKQRGAPAQRTFSRENIVRAYEDLYELSKSAIHCLQDTQDMDVFRACFADADKIIQYHGDAQDIMKRRITTTHSDLAYKILSEITNLGRSTIAGYKKALRSQ